MALKFNPFTGTLDFVGAGSAGPQGPPGVQGASAPILEGPQGDEGERGFPGPQGPAGSAGATGPAGAAGSQGPPGADGISGDDAEPNLPLTTSLINGVPYSADPLTQYAKLAGRPGSTNNLTLSTDNIGTLAGSAGQDQSLVLKANTNGASATALMQFLGTRFEFRSPGFGLAIPIRQYSDGNTSYIDFVVSDLGAGAQLYKWPLNTPSADNQVLTGDVGGNMSWTTPVVNTPTLVAPLVLDTPLDEVDPVVPRNNVSAQSSGSLLLDNYLYLPGRPGGQTATGGTATGNALTFHANTADRTSLIELDDTVRLGTTLPDPGAGTITFAKIDRTLTLATSSGTWEALNISPALTFTGGSNTCRNIHMGGTISRNFGPGALNFMSGLYVDYESTASGVLPWLPDYIFDNSTRTLTSGTVTNPNGGNLHTGVGTVSSSGTAVTGVGTKFTTQLLPNNQITAAGQIISIASITDDLHLTLNAAPSPPWSGAAFTFQSGQLDLFLNLTPTIRVNGASASLNLGGGVAALYWFPGLQAIANSAALTIDRVSCLWDNGLNVATSGSPPGTVTVNKSSTVYAEDSFRTFATRYAVVDSNVSTNSGKNWFLYHSGTATSSLVGTVRLGDNTVAVDQLEVVGNINFVTGFLKINTLAQTFSSDTTLMTYTAGDTITGAGTGLKLLAATGTLTATLGPAPSILYANLTVSRTSGGVGLVTWNCINDVPTFTNTLATNMTSGTVATAFHSPTYSCTSTGTISGIVDAAISSSAAVGSLCTIATRTGLTMNEWTGAGAVTTQVAVDVGALTHATNNLSLRSQTAGCVLQHLGAVYRGQDPGTFEVPDGYFTDFVEELILTGTEEGAALGTGEIAVI